VGSNPTSPTMKKKIQAWIVDNLERVCSWTHFITLHRPWLWLFGHCPLASWSARLDDKWETGVWKSEEKAVE
jgi:hypothetical protein